MAQGGAAFGFDEMKNAFMQGNAAMFLDSIALSEQGHMKYRTVHVYPQVNAQINQAVSHLDQMTQQNAALVEESTAAAASLTEQAQRLADAVNAFQTDAQRG